MDIVEIEKLKNQFKILSDDELVNIVTTERNNFRSKAIAIAENELQRRGIIYGANLVEISNYPDYSDSDLLAMISGERLMHADGKAAIAHELQTRGVEFEMIGASFGIQSQVDAQQDALQTENPELRYHTFWRRFWADFLDTLILLLPLGGLQWFFRLTQNIYIIIFGNLISFALQSWYRVWFHANNNGQTIGKRVTGIRVLDVTESRPPTLRESFMRDSIYIAINSVVWVCVLSLILLGGSNNGVRFVVEIFSLIDSLWFLVRVVSMLLNTKRRGIHDQMANTVVIKTKYLNTPK
jgi:uncharacterized RDD family membrane protein YckC